MGLLTELLLVPLAPARLALWSVNQLVDSATQEVLGPDAMRRELIELSRQFDEGLIDADEFEALEEQILDRLELLASP